MLHNRQIRILDTLRRDFHFKRFPIKLITFYFWILTHGFPCRKGPPPQLTQIQIFTLIQAQLIGETWLFRLHTCRTDATEPWGSANTSLSRRWSLWLLCNDLAFVRIIQTSQFAPCDLSALVTEQLRLKKCDTSRKLLAFVWKSWFCWK